MNPKILELAKAHLVRDEHTEFGWQECHKYVFDPEELQQFAESIIEECIEASAGCYNRYGDSARIEIKQHLGIEL